MKKRSKSKKRLVLNSRDIHVGWIVGSAIFMIVCLLATFALAYRHDAYSAKLGLGDLMTTDVWFRVFLALTCFSLLLFLGLLVYAFIAGIIGKSGDNKGQASRMAAKTPVAREMAPAFKKKAPVVSKFVELDKKKNRKCLKSNTCDFKKCLGRDARKCGVIRANLT